MKKQINNQQIIPQSSLRNSRKGRSLLSASRDINKNLSDSNQKIRNNSSSADAKEQKIPEKKGIYVSKIIYKRPLTANQPIKNQNVQKIEEEDQVNDNQLNEYNNRPSTVGMKKSRGEQKNNSSSKRNVIIIGQQSNSKEQVSTINYQQTVSKSATKPPINKKQNASKAWLLMMKSVQEYEQDKKQKTNQLNQFSFSKDDGYDEIKEKRVFCNFQAELNKYNNRQQKQNELLQTLHQFKESKSIQQEELVLKNLNQILIHSPNSIIEQTQDNYFRKTKQDGFKPKSNCPSAFYAIKKHFNLKKKEEEQQKPQSSLQGQEKNSLRIPLLGNNRVYQTYQAKIYGIIAQRENALSGLVSHKNYQK